ncbi:macrophage-expressed gene 1 protein-like isoform X1 [Alosa pseudoharengus]|uniref:macrophage-expressed gene 1 protein-like isoform X1 n=1 Tax=Alosa pseudoharengus TaxID=34774 RepID=UPI003F8CB766
MDLSLGRVLVLCVLGHCLCQPLPRPSNGLLECRKTVNSPALGVLPGGGWDNLRNLDMGRVMNISYRHCHTTEDGVYLIPDEVFVIPQKVSGVETNSEIVSSWQKQHSSTALSINAEASFLSVLNAKFSRDNQRMKIHQVMESSVTARIQVRNHLYTVKAYPNFALDSRFACQAEEIADAVVNNQTRQAIYLSERLVLSYGSHVITTVEAGASLVHEDYLRASYVSTSDTEKSTVSALAGASFFSKLNIDGKSTGETAEARMYEGNITYSFTQGHGGALFYPGITLQKWQESTLNNLVAIDRAGMPLHFFLNRAAFPHLPEPTVFKMATLVRQAAERYYKINSRPGCVKPDSKNFNFQANIDDGSCDGLATNLSFGGVYQQCSKLTPDADPICNDHAQANPDTGDYSCRESFRSILLQSEVQEQGYTEYECHKESVRCWVISTCSKTVCGNSYHVRRARIDTFWCSTVKDTVELSGYLFGGLYSLSRRNPLTKSMSCPPNFFPRKLLASGLMVCLSNDYEGGSQYSVPFGGFFSCKSGNPLAGGLQRCPPQFSQHLAAISDGCQVLYCVQSDVFTAEKLLPINLPPFTRPPLVNMIATNTVAVMTEGGMSWVRMGETRTWRLAKPEDIRRLSEELDPSAKVPPSRLSTNILGWQIFGVTMACIVLALILIGIVLLARRRNKQRRTPELPESRECQQFINDGQISDGGEDDAEVFSVRL